MAKPITFEHPMDEGIKYIVYPDPKDPRWFKVTIDAQGEEEWEQLKKKNPEAWQSG